MAKNGFGKKVAARTRAATQMLATADQLAAVKAAGGLKADLQAIIDLGTQAEALSLAQHQAAGTGVTATIDVQAAFAAAQHEYTAVMAVVHAVVDDSRLSAADATELKRILKNEAAVVVHAEGGPAEGAEPSKPKKTMRASRSHEALRTEISRDAAALLAVTGAKALLTERGIAPSRLTALRTAADALEGKLAARVSAKGVSQGSSQALYAAVDAQAKAWDRLSRVLARAARHNSSLAALLKEVADAR